MISARRAREADLDKAASPGFQAGRNLSTLPRTFQRRSRAVNSGARVLLSQGRPVESAGCTARRFRGTETQAFVGKPNDDRTAHLEHAERPQDLGRARGNGAALQGD